MSDAVETRRLNRHPIRGFLGGLLLGLGAVILLALFGGAAFTTWWPFAVIVGSFVVLGVVVGLFTPPRTHVGMRRGT